MRANSMPTVLLAGSILPRFQATSIACLIALSTVLEVVSYFLATLGYNSYVTAPRRSIFYHKSYKKYTNLAFPNLNSYTVLGKDEVMSIDSSIGLGLVFILAAIPLIEILIVIPMGLAAGIEPYLVLIAAVLGNTLSVGLLIILYARAKDWIMSKYTPKETSWRYRKFQELWDKYGLTGTALVAPILTGGHLAATLGLTLGSEEKKVFWWLSLSILTWSFIITASLYFGWQGIKAVI